MKKSFEKPTLNVIRFEVTETLTSDAAAGFSNNVDYDAGIGEW